MKLLLRLYPRWWRRRYGAEALEILEGRQFTLTALVDLLAAALDAWLNQAMPPSSPDAGEATVGDAPFHAVGERIDRSRIPPISVAASVAVLACECLACCIAGSWEWGDRGYMAGIDSFEAAEQARFAIELYAIGALNVLAAVPFLLRRSGWSWWLVIGVHVGTVVLALIEGVVADLGWFFFSGLPALTLSVLFAVRHAEARLDPHATNQLPSSGW